MLKKLFAILTLALAPALVFPQGVYGDESVSGPYGPGASSYTTTGHTFGSLVNAFIVPLVNAVIPVLVALALVYFFIGLIKYIQSKDKKDHRTGILWSLVALFVLFSMWGILRVLQNTFLVDTGPSGHSTYPILPF